MNRSQFLRRAFGGAIAAGVVAVTAVPAFAQSDKADKANRGAAAQAKRRAVQGELTAVSGTAPTLKLTLTTKRGESVVVSTNADTEFRGKDHEDLTLASLTDKSKLGLRVIAQGERSGSDIVAKHLIVRPAKEQGDAAAKDKKKQDRQEAGRTTTVGVVSELAADGSSFKLTPTGGSAVTFKVTADTEKTLTGTATFANGVTARVVSTKDAAGNSVALRIRVPA